MPDINLTVGCDPEFFVKDVKTGAFRCAHGLIPGTKEHPHPVNNGAVQVDGFALEYNIGPVTNADDFVRYNQEVMAQLRDMVPVNLDFAFVPSCRFNGNHFRAQPDEAKELGCTPDFNAYTMAENPKPDNNTTMRTASGHIHLGGFPSDDPFGVDHMTKCATLVKQLDVYLGLPSVIFDKNKERRAMYGKAGAFRPKPYGLEYRVLSNAWLTSEARMRFVFEQSVRAVQDLMKGKRAIEYFGGEHILTGIIDNSDTYNANYQLAYGIPGGPAILAQANKLAKEV